MRPESQILDWKALLKVHRDELERNDERYPGLCDTEDFYQSSLQPYKHAPYTDRELCETFDNVFEALDHYLEYSCPTPPELLMTLRDIYGIYKSARGNLELEELFFGVRLPRIGNYAARSAKRFEHMLLSMDLFVGERKGKSKKEVAEEFITKRGLNIDPESILTNHARYLKDQADN